MRFSNEHEFFDILIQQNKIWLRILWDGCPKVETWGFNWIMFYATSKAAVYSAAPVGINPDENIALIKL